MTTEEIWDKFMGKGDFMSLSVHNKSLIKGILGEYSKQQAIAFATFRDEFKRAESRRVREEEKRLGGMITWMPQSDEYIYNQFIEQQKTQTK
jgi:hypothetical protein